MELAAKAGEARFVAYVESLTQALSHEDRAQPFQDYCTGLLMLGERKSVEPMVAPSRVSAEHQSLLHFVGQAPWSDAAVLGKVPIPMKAPVYNGIIPPGDSGIMAPPFYEMIPPGCRVR